MGEQCLWTVIRWVQRPQHPIIAHKGQPYSNLPHCRIFEYEHINVELSDEKLSMPVYLR